MYKLKLKIFTKCLKKMLQEIFRSSAKNFSFLYALQRYCYHLNHNVKHSLVQSLSLSEDVLKFLLRGRHHGSSIWLYAGSLYQLAGDFQCILQHT